MKNRFNKNLYRHLLFEGILLIINIALITSYCVMLTQPQPSNAWVLLCLALVLDILYFLIAAFWIFQTVEISNEGITVYLFNRVLKKRSWEQIIDITEHNYVKISKLRIPMIVLGLKGEEICLDMRKPIVEVVESYSGMQILTIQQQIENAKKAENPEEVEKRKMAVARIKKSFAMGLAMAWTMEGAFCSILIMDRGLNNALPEILTLLIPSCLITLFCWWRIRSIDK